MALLYVLRHLSGELRLSLVAATVDHGLRAGAAAEVEWVEARAAELAVPFISRRVQVPAGPSLHAQARRSRYQALHAMATEMDAPLIAVGHTRDDQAETVIARTLRGASVLGLSSIEPRRADGVVRPLIDVSRVEVLDYHRSQGTSYLDDPSNREERFLRTRIRRDVMPLLEALDPKVRDHLADLADDARAARDAVREAGAAVLASARRGEGIERECLAACGEAVRREAIRQWLGARGLEPSRVQLVAADRALLAGSGQVALREGVTLRSDERALVLVAGPLRFGRGS